MLRAKVGLKDVSDEFAPWAAWGHPAEAERALGGERSWKWGNGETAQVGWEVEPGEWPATEEELGAWDARAPGMGWRGLVRAGATRECSTLRRLAHVGLPADAADTSLAPRQHPWRAARPSPGRTTTSTTDSCAAWPRAPRISSP